MFLSLNHHNFEQTAMGHPSDHGSSPLGSPPICQLSHPPVLSLGDRGREVAMLRRLLSDSTKIRPGQSQIIAGERFTPVVEQFVKQFQHQTFLQADGIVGLETWRTLCADSPVHLITLEQGDRGPDVRQLQERLYQLNFYVDHFDGWFGQRTLAAVQAFQGDRSLTLDGIVGPRTWDALSRPVGIDHAPCQPSS